MPVECRIGEEGTGFRYILDSLNPERILNAAEVVGMGRRALEKAVAYADERVVFGRKIGQNQSIQHPLAECWSELYAAESDDAARGRALRRRSALRRAGERREISRGRRRFQRLRPRDPHPWRHGLCGRVPCRALFSGNGGHPVGPCVARNDPVLHRRARARPAEILLTMSFLRSSAQLRRTRISTEMRGRALWIWIDREQRRNAMNKRVIAGIEQQCFAAQQDPADSLRRADRAGRKGVLRRRRSQRRHRHVHARPGRADDGFRQAGPHHPQAAACPSSRRINGDCVAGGMGLMALCDLAVVADHARFGLPEAKVGVFPMQVLVFLRSMIGARHVNELCLTGELIDAARAREIGHRQLRRAVRRTRCARRCAGRQAGRRCRRWRCAAANTPSPRWRTMAFPEALAFAETLIAVTSLTGDATEGLGRLQRAAQAALDAGAAKMTDKLVRIGGASGAWGDSPGAIGQLLGAGVDYLMMDYLAEVTMSLLARARMKDPEAGYPAGFRRLSQAPSAGDRAPAASRSPPTPAASTRPPASARIEAVIAELGLSLRVAVVEGDDVMPLIDTLRADGLREAVSGETLPARLLTANAYLGALPIKAAFDAGADIVITGRCADSALALGILMHEFGWAADDYDRLAPAAWSATCWNAARRRPAAPSPTGRTCPTGTISAIRSPNAGATAVSWCPSPRAPAG